MNEELYFNVLEPETGEILKALFTDFGINDKQFVWGDYDKAYGVENGTFVKYYGDKKGFEKGKEYFLVEKETDDALKEELASLKDAFWILGFGEGFDLEKALDEVEKDTPGFMDNFRELSYMKDGTLKKTPTFNHERDEEKDYWKEIEEFDDCYVCRIQMPGKTKKDVELVQYDSEKNVLGINLKYKHRPYSWELGKTIKTNTSEPSYTVNGGLIEIILPKKQ